MVTWVYVAIVVVTITSFLVWAFGVGKWW